MHTQAFAFILFVLFAILQVVDGYLTWKVVSIGGKEVNPLVQRLISWFGLIPGLCIPKLVTTVLTGLWILDYWGILFFLVLVYVMVILNNLKALRKQQLIVARM